MSDFNYLVYDNGDLLAGFTMLVTAVTFIEEYRINSSIPVSLVDGHTGEILDTYIRDAWEDGTY